MVYTRVLLSCILGALGIAYSGSGRAADHGDTPLLISEDRPSARLTDLFAFVRGANLVLIVCTDPTVPAGMTEYLFPPDLTLKILIDNNSEVRFDDPNDLATFGGTITRPAKIKEDIVFRVRFDEDGAPRLHIKRLPGSVKDEVLLFTGLRDDPFIRRPRIGRNVAAIVIELPLEYVLDSEDVLLIWATAGVPGIRGGSQDLAGRALRSQFPENDQLNTLHPRLHTSLLGVPPDVIIYDTSRPVEFPNGRELTDDVVDLVGRSLPNEDPSPDENDVPFLDGFPYLAPPQ